MWEEQYEIGGQYFGKTERIVRTNTDSLIGCLFDRSSVKASVCVQEQKLCWVCYLPRAGVVLLRRVSMARPRHPIYHQHRLTSLCLAVFVCVFVCACVCVCVWGGVVLHWFLWQSPESFLRPFSHHPLLPVPPHTLPIPHSSAQLQTVYNKKNMQPLLMYI